MENPKKTKIVCIGGGGGMPTAVLPGLKKYPINLSVISAMLDSGGSAGRERKKYNTKISFGDIRRAFYALSGAPKQEKEGWNSRIQSGNQNLVISNTTSSIIVRETNDPEMAIDFLGKVFMIPKQHKVLPSTLDNAELCAKLEGGGLVRGENKIDVPRKMERAKIKQAYLDPPTARAYPMAEKAIKEADLVVIGPGDLYSSLAQILLIDGIAESIKTSKAKIVYITNAMTKRGETDDFSVLEMTNEIEKYLGGLVDYVIYNKSLPSKERINKTKAANSSLIDVIRVDENLPKEKFIGGNLLPKSGLVIHDSQKLAKIILSICKL